MRKDDFKILVRIRKKPEKSDDDVCLILEARAECEFMKRLTLMATKQGYHVSIEPMKEEKGIKDGQQANVIKENN